MKELYIVLFISFFSIFNSHPIQAQCVDCEIMVCDGITCDDGSSGDGVQTSRKCGCGDQIQGACAIIEIDLTTNPYYDPYDTNCGLYFTTQESGNFWIYLVEPGCSVDDCSTPDYIVKGAETFRNLPDVSSFTMMVCKEGGNAGRRDFNFSVSCTTVENCVNAIDDDFDTLVDCDDPSCSLTEYCPTTESSTTEDGGLESNNRLAEKIVKRKFKKSISANISTLQPFLYSEDRRVSNGRNDFSLEDFIPSSAIDDAKLINASPYDLVAITNAEEILGVDYLVDNKRVASILECRSVGKIYEHSKQTCDRLSGSEIANIWKYSFAGDLNYIVTKFISDDGTVEYNCNLALVEKQDGMYVMENFWSLGEYSSGQNVYSFQLWANNFKYLEDLVLSFMRNTNEIVNISNVFSGNLPEVLVSNFAHENGELILDIVNYTGVKSLDLNGNITYTETSSTVPFNTTISLSGEIIEQVKIPSGGAYDLSFQLGTQGVKDEIYIADGAWGVDDSSEEITIHHFSVEESDVEIFDDKKLIVERNVSLAASSDVPVPVFRSFNADFSAINVKDLQLLELKASGNCDVEVVLVDPLIIDWEKQPRASIRLAQELTTFRLSKQMFGVDNDTWGNYSMIVFVLKNQSNHIELINAKISDVIFKNADLQYDVNFNDIRILSNPMHTQSVIQFDTQISGSYFFELVNTAGEKIQNFQGVASHGVNNLVIKNHNYRPGIYYARIILSDGSILSDKIVII